MKKLIPLTALALSVMSLSTSINAQTENAPASRVYEVTVTNITKGQSFTPILSATHKRGVQLFNIGTPASDELATLAESGGTDSLQAQLDAESKVAATNVAPGLLNPGQTTSFTIEAKRNFNRLSFAAMLIPTNDSFVAVKNLKLPKYGSRTVLANAYDAGSETNDENCMHIPGPICGGVGLSPNDIGEGFVYPSPGISGEADLSSLGYNWQGKVAKVEVKRVQ